MKAFTRDPKWERVQGTSTKTVVGTVEVVDIYLWLEIDGLPFQGRRSATLNAYDDDLVCKALLDGLVRDIETKILKVTGVS